MKKQNMAFFGLILFVSMMVLQVVKAIDFNQTITPEDKQLLRTFFHWENMSHFFISSKLGQT